MKFSIKTINDNGTGMDFDDMDSFLEEIRNEIRDAHKNGATTFDAEIICDQSVFAKEQKHSHPLMGRTITILSKNGKDRKEGVVTNVDEKGRLYGTWGDFPVRLEFDDIILN